MHGTDYTMLFAGGQQRTTQEVLALYMYIADTITSKVVVCLCFYAGGAGGRHRRWLAV